MALFCLHRQRPSLRLPESASKEGHGGVQKHQPREGTAQEGEGPAGQPARRALQQRLEKVEENEAAEPKPDARIERDPPLKIQRVRAVVPHPAARREFHDVAADELDHRRDGPGRREDEQGRNRKLPDADVAVPQPSQGEDQHQGAHPVDRAVGPEEEAPVGEALPVYDDLEKYLVQPSENGV